MFRAFKGVRKRNVKIAHAAFHTGSVIFISLGLAVEFISHHYSGESELYSLHSWIGLATVTVFFSQFVFGLLCYLSPFQSPVFSDKIKAIYLPIHVYLGTVCFVMAIATSLIGLNQNARFNTKYSDFTDEGLLINLIGLLMIVYGLLVVYLLTKSSYKRLSQDEAKEVAS